MNELILYPDELLCNVAAVTKLVLAVQATGHSSQLLSICLHRRPAALPSSCCSIHIVHKLLWPCTAIWTAMRMQLYLHCVCAVKLHLLGCSIASNNILAGQVL